MIYRALGLIFFGGFIDLALWGLLQSPFPYCSRAVLYTLIGTQAPLEILMIALVPALWPFFFLADSMGTDLGIIVCLGSFLHYVHSIAYIPLWGLMGTVFCTVMVHSFLLEGLMAQVPLLTMPIFALIGSISVVYLHVGSQGNRSRL